jgi:glycosyltransferase involved in cell wall biosynthesis
MEASLVPISGDARRPAGSPSQQQIRVVLVHTIYQQRAGEETVFEMEKHLLASAGHLGGAYVRENDEISRYGFWSMASLGPRTLWAWDSYRQLRDLLRQAKPDVVHFHNTFPLVSPAAYYACRHEDVKVVQTLHNYRLLCPVGTFYRQGRVCEDCVHKGLWQAVRHGCYRRSHVQTAVVAAMLLLHRALRTWQSLVDRYIVPSNSALRLLTAAGLPANKLVVKPNFVYPDPGPRRPPCDHALFIGRLSTEKGPETLLEAWNRLSVPASLRVIGEGPLRSRLEAGTNGWPRRIFFEGRLSRSQALSALKSGRFLVFPSRCYELFPMAIVEAFACGVPVIASRLGGPEEIVEDGRTGLHFTPGDPDDLAAKVEWAWTHPEEMAEMGRAARAEYEAKYTAERNYQMLMEIYQKALGAEG